MMVGVASAEVATECQRHFRVAGVVRGVQYEFPQGSEVTLDAIEMAGRSRGCYQLDVVEFGPHADLGRPFAGVFGVRPEHIHSKGEVRDPDPGRIARVNVSVVEPLGSEVYAYLSANGHEFISRMDATANPRAGETIETVFDTDHLHVFDKETEQALV